MHWYDGDDVEVLSVEVSVSVFLVVRRSGAATRESRSQLRESHSESRAVFWGSSFTLRCSISDQLYCLDLSRKRRTRLRISVISLTCLNLHCYWLRIKLTLINTYSFGGHVLNCQCLQTSKSRGAGNIGHVNTSMSVVVDRQTAKNVYTMKFKFVDTNDVAEYRADRVHANNTPSINLTHTTEPLQVLCKWCMLKNALSWWPCDVCPYIPKYRPMLGRYIRNSSFFQTPHMSTQFRIQTQPEGRFHFSMIINKIAIKIINSR